MKNGGNTEARGKTRISLISKLIRENPRLPRNPRLKEIR